MRQQLGRTPSVEAQEEDFWDLGLIHKDRTNSQIAGSVGKERIRLDSLKLVSERWKGP